VASPAPPAAVPRLRRRGAGPGAAPGSRGGAGGQRLSVQAAPGATAEERERLRAGFVRLCEIESPTGRERGVADAVAAELRAAGLEVHEDGTGPETGSDAGNLLARIEGPEGTPTVLLCAHLDTVPLEGPVE